MKQIIWKYALCCIGLLFLFIIIRAYGFDKLTADLGKIGWHIIPLTLSFIPTLLCYTAAWYLSTDIPQSIQGSLYSRAVFFLKLFRITVLAIAWNNLSPFLKVLGEPLRLILLQKEIADTRRSVESVVVLTFCNIAGTLASFIVGALTLPIFFPMPEGIRLTLHIAALGSLLSLGFVFLIPLLGNKFLRRQKRLRKLSLWLSWSSRKTLQFFVKRKLAVLGSIFFSFIARYVEGLTFYLAFSILGIDLPFMSAAYLDVGRALADTIFFFIPYQLASRELVIGFMLENVFLIGGSAFVGASLFYRLVEIIWMMIGYALSFSINIKSPKALSAIQTSPESVDQPRDS